MANCERKCKLYVVRETGKEPRLEITMSSKWNHKQCLFRRAYTTPSQYYTITKQIILPSKPKTKRDSENENEYHFVNITRTEIKPKFTPGPYCYKTWDILVNRWFSKRRNNIITYNDPFKVLVFEKQGFENAYIFDNEYDRKFEWYEIGKNEINNNNN